MHSDRHQIALLYGKENDVKMLRKIFSCDSYVVVACDSASSLISKLSSRADRGESVASHYMVLVCARKANLKKAGATDSIVGELVQLVQLCDRVIVLSDSMEESIVCAYMFAGAHDVIPIGDSACLMKARLNARFQSYDDLPVI